VTESQYAQAGVDLAAADDAKTRIGKLVASTRTSLSVGEVGAFGGMLRVPAGMKKPVLVMSTDGVGTKVLVATQAGKLDTVGECLVNHSVNDILVHGATPIAFQDYVAGARLDAPMMASIVDGVARACRAHGMALTGGETAAMPGLYQMGHFDLAGTIVGVVEEDQALHGDRIRPGDKLVAYLSSGLHTNGYTLARRVLFDVLKLQLDAPLGDTGQTVAESLLAVHRSYFHAVMPVISKIHGIAHITGGGIPGNLVRVLPEGCEAVVDSKSWEWPPLFRTLQSGGKVATEEMRDVFNLGVGLIAVLPAKEVDAVQSAARGAGVETWVLGEVRAGTKGVRFSP
jgi:phosphoribosylformylglycinamidine cyclo-ligase